MLTNPLQILTKSNQHLPLFRMLVFVVLTVACAFWSSSTPDEFGIAEAVIGASLFIFVGLRGTLVALGGFMQQRQTGLSQWAFVCFWGLLFLPLIWGLTVRQNSLNDIVRDVIPLLYFFLPVFFIPHMSKHPTFWKKMCLVSLCTIGLSYSVRHFLGSSIEIVQFGQEIIFTDSNYFPMDPAVLFSSTFLLVVGALKILDKKYFSGLASLLLGCVAFACLAAIVVRAQIFIVLFSVIFAISINAWKKPKNPRLWIVVIALTVVSLSGAVVSEVPRLIYELILAKSEHAGILNSRDLEAYAVISSATSSVSNLLLGHGWGGVIDAFSSGEFVRYTHNIVLYLLLKGGLFGFAFGFLYCLITVSVLISYFIKSIRSNPTAHNYAVDIALSFAVANNLFLNLLIEPGFKMFSFGLVMTVLWLAILERKRQHQSGLNYTQLKKFGSYQCTKEVSDI